MGYGNWDQRDYTSYSTANNLKSASRHTVFSNTSLKETVSPKHFKNGVRESRDAEEGKPALPVILALDVTGSMGQIPHNLIKDWLPNLMLGIINGAHKYPQLMFMGIGDVDDQAPIQASQFELETELVLQALREIWLEGNGQGNREEGYSYAWLMAARFIQTDQSQKRGQKGILITIGDEKLNQEIPLLSLRKSVGGDFNEGLSSKWLYEQASKDWHIIHIHCTDGSYSTEMVKPSWSILGENFYAMDSTKIVDFVVQKVKQLQNFSATTDVPTSSIEEDIPQTSSRPEVDKKDESYL